jgi:uncharacterized protein (DUF2147 family)
MAGHRSRSLRAADAAARSRPDARARRGLAILLCAMIGWLPAQASMAQPHLPQGVWIIDNKAAVQIFDCAGLMCGKIVWLYKPRNALGQLDRDAHNPNPALRERELCGAVIIWGLRPVGPNTWRGGWFYNADDGKTYNLQADQTSADTITARIFKGLPLFGRTKIMMRVPLQTTEGWC